MDKSIEILEAIDPEMVEKCYSYDYLLQTLFGWDEENECMFDDEYYCNLIYECYDIDETIAEIEKKIKEEASIIAENPDMWYEDREERINKMKEYNERIVILKDFESEMFAKLIQ